MSQFRSDAMSQFRSDNVTCACPEVLEAVVAVNSGNAVSYGGDDWTLGLQAKLSEIFETEVVALPVVTGTAANALALSAIAPPYGNIYCHKLAHINTDECGAPELFSGGAKLIPIDGQGAKLNANSLAAAIAKTDGLHFGKPAAVSITQSCEAGTVYELDEIAGIAETAHNSGLKVHMDGARFTNALVSLGVSPAEMTWKSGIDVLSFGGTKNGCMAAEAVVLFDPQLAKSFPYLHKRGGQLISKMRFISAQLVAYLSNDVWLRNARHANSLATRLSSRLAAIPGIGIAAPTQANEVFVRLPKAVIENLRAEGYVFRLSESFDMTQDTPDSSVVRFVTSWNTKTDDIDQLVEAAGRSCVDA